MKDMGLRNISSPGLFPLVLYFDQIQKITRYGNAQDGKHNGSAVKYGRTPKPQGATILINQAFLHVCLACLQAFLEEIMSTPVDVQVSQCIN